MEAIVRRSDQNITVVGLKCKKKFVPYYIHHLPEMEILFIEASDGFRTYNKFSRPGENIYLHYGVFAELKLNEGLFNPSL